MTRGQLGACIAATITCSTIAPIAAAQDSASKFPSKSVRIVVGFGAGEGDARHQAGDAGGLERAPDLLVGGVLVGRLVGGGLAAHRFSRSSDRRVSSRASTTTSSGSQSRVTAFSSNSMVNV